MTRSFLSAQSTLPSGANPEFLDFASKAPGERYVLVIPFHRSAKFLMHATPPPYRSLILGPGNLASWGCDRRDFEWAAGQLSAYRFL
jgi:hypothetical protein